jgi:hypothetical protein
VSPVKYEQGFHIPEDAILLYMHKVSMPSSAYSICQDFHMLKVIRQSNTRDTLTGLDAGRDPDFFSTIN